MIILENEYLRASIKSLGAELQSLQNKKTGIEHMWSGNPAFWPKFSPVLFPIVGQLKDETYFYNDGSYKLSRHGFAREKEFTAEQVSNEEAIFTLRPDAQTLEVYPFDFILRLRYKLQVSTLSCSYEVENPGANVLLFSIGAHPAFAVPLSGNTSYNDYELRFNKAESLHRWKLKDGLLNTETSPVQTDGKSLHLTKALFYEDAIVLKNLQSDCITLASDKHDHGIHFRFSGFPFFGIWAAKDAPFVCLEPWCGIADNIHHNQQLQDKEGIETLEPGANFQRSWSVEPF